MLPYPSTSRRQCAPTRCPRITTIALIGTLFACVYHSRRFVSQEQLSLDRKSDIDNLTLAPAVEVVKEVAHQADISALDTDHAHVNTLNDASTNHVAAEDDRQEDSGENLVGLIPDTRNDNLSDVGTDTDAVPAVEKNEQDSADNAAPPGQENLVDGAALDEAAARTEDTPSNASQDIVDREVSASEKQDDAVAEQAPNAEREEADDKELKAGLVDGKEEISDKQTDIAADSVDGEEKLSEKEAVEAVEKQEEVADEEPANAERQETEDKDLVAGIVDGDKNLSEKETVNEVEKQEIDDEEPANAERQETEDKDLVAGIVDGDKNLSEKETVNEVEKQEIDDEEPANAERQETEDKDLVAGIVDGEEKLSEIKKETLENGEVLGLDVTEKTEKEDDDQAGGQSFTGTADDVIDGSSRKEESINEDALDSHDREQRLDTTSTETERQGDYDLEH